MSTNTSIEWTDRTWNPVTHENRLLDPLSWRKPSKVFVNSMSDLFHEDVPDAFIDKVFAVMALAPQHTFQVLTKRPERMRAYMSNTRGAEGVICRVNTAGRDIPKGSWWKGEHTSWPWRNVWLGVSVEDQPRADERIPLLLQTPAAVRFISAEPLLGPIHISNQFIPWLDWVIIGGESGPYARPCDLAWVRSIVAQCNTASVACFVKQLGARPIAGRMPHPDDMFIRLASRKGGDPAEWSEDLRIRQFPGAV